MKYIPLMVGSLLLSTPLATAAQAPAQQQYKQMKDTEESLETSFVRTASMSGTFEIAVGRLALQKSNDEAVKEFAQKLMQDHQKANIRLEQSYPQNFTVDLDEKHQETLNKLQQAGPASFNDIFLSTQIEMHQDAIELYEKYAEEGRDAQLRDFARETLPDLKNHLKIAEKLD